jgi:hypothetical protein
MRGHEASAVVSVFGPFYPPALQGAVNHAERLSELLAAHELAPPTERWAKVWTTGRADEVLRFAEHVVGLWQGGQLAEGGAAAMLEGYIEVVHEGIAAHLGCAAPSCCAAEAAETTRGRLSCTTPA